MNVQESNFNSQLIIVFKLRKLGGNVHEFVGHGVSIINIAYHGGYLSVLTFR